MYINKKKIEFSIKYEDAKLEYVDRFCYLGKFFYSDNMIKKIKYRIAQAKLKFNQMNKLSAK